MDNYLVDRETLGQFADALIKTKYQNTAQDTPEITIAKAKEKIINALDQRVSNAIFDDLDSLQLAELSHLLDDGDSTESTFADFFKRNNIDLEQKITDVFMNYKIEFLGGANA